MFEIKVIISCPDLVAAAEMLVKALRPAAAESEAPAEPKKTTKRGSKAKQEVEREIRTHIEDQAQAYEQAGRTREEALEEAVRQMGSPVEVGIDMDRIHRPKNNWMVLGMAMLLSLAGLLVQYFCIYRFGTENLYRINQDAFARQCLYTFLGLGFMSILYFCDYSLFSRYGN